MEGIRVVLQLSKRADFGFWAYLVKQARKGELQGPLTVESRKFKVDGPITFDL
ncbi:MAG: hypothetical protein ACE145_17035 [Terriglobia bacterium]